MQVFYTKDETIRSARIRHYIRIEAGKPKFSYCNQSLAYAQTQLENSQKLLINTGASKEIAIGEKPSPDQNGQANGQLETSSSSQNMGGRRLVWFRTLAFQANDPGFKSRRPHQILSKWRFSGKRSSMLCSNKDEWVAPSLGSEVPACTP